MGDRVKLSTDIEVLGTPGGASLGRQHEGAQGMVSEYPVVPSPGADNYYKVDFDNSIIDGWVMQGALVKVVTYMDSGDNINSASIWNAVNNAVIQYYNESGR